MPYKIKKFKNKTCVYKKNTNEKIGCTKGPIKKYLGALYSAELKNEVNMNKTDLRTLAKQLKLNTRVLYIRKNPETGELEKVPAFIQSRNKDAEFTEDSLWNVIPNDHKGRAVLKLGTKAEYNKTFELADNSFDPIIIDTNKNPLRKNAKYIMKRGSGKTELITVAKVDDYHVYFRKNDNETGKLSKLYMLQDHDIIHQDITFEPYKKNKKIETKLRKLIQTEIKKVLKEEKDETNVINDFIKRLNLNNVKEMVDEYIRLRDFDDFEYLDRLNSAIRKKLGNNYNKFSKALKDAHDL